MYLTCAENDRHNGGSYQLIGAHKYTERRLDFQVFRGIAGAGVAQNARQVEL